ncbi:MAG TPA: hypothetical protein VHE54_12540 [Puia sp.]|nr:hypothetical protein [Puia sp.]
METRLSGLSGSELRKLALAELKQFIQLLDKGATGELQRKKAYLTIIFAYLSDKEQEELQRLVQMVADTAAVTHEEKPAPSGTIYHPQEASPHPCRNIEDSGHSALQQSA